MTRREEVVRRMLAMLKIRAFQRIIQGLMECWREGLLDLVIDEAR